MDVQTAPDLARWSRRAFLSTAAAALVTAGVGAGTGPLGPLAAGAAPTAARWKVPSRKRVVADLGRRRPKHFGMFLDGMVTRGRRRSALTFDACGGPRGAHYDEKLITTLRRHEVPATLFLNARWIEAFPTVAAELAADPLFELGNHGHQHCPLTVRGQEAYKIPGTKSVGAAYDEIRRGMDAVAELTGTRTRLFRPGTAWADDVGVAVARAMGVRVVSFSINVDEGATASTAKVAENLGLVRSRSITLAHVNHPEGRTAEGLAKALPRLLDEGRRFVRLGEALA